MGRSESKRHRTRRRRNQSRRRREDHPSPQDFATPRSEAEVFAELTSLCASDGYIHALSYIIYRDSVVTAGEEFTKEDFLKLYDRERLIRTELAVVIGLWLKGDRSLDIPDPSAVQEMIERTDGLLAELHAAMLAPARNDFMAALELRQSGLDVESPLGKAAAMREAIFYSGESAFTFQYSQFARERYASDAKWLRENHGFDIATASDFFEKLISHLSDNIPSRLSDLANLPPSEWTILPIFCFTEDEAAQVSGFSGDIVRAIIKAFSAPGLSKNESYRSLFTFNEAAVYPFVQLENGAIAFLLEYVGTEGLYNSPSYWMRSDLTYANTAAKHRGEFAERVTYDFVKRVFPDDRIYRNIVFKPSKTVTAGEADLILVHGKRAFVFQLKSKGLTELARTGDELAISRDFTAAIQHAYDQAVVCIDLLKSAVPAYKDGKAIKIAHIEAVEEFYPVCITSENYPSLAFQVGQYLKEDDRSAWINHPIILDIFTFDAITEFLRTPLYLVDYQAKRSALFDKVAASHELVLLSFHLRGNLFVPSDVHLLLVEDDFMVELDIAMAVRRRGLPGSDTPSGILTRDLDNPLGRILEVSNESDRPEVHQLGEFILNLSSDSWKTINRWVGNIAVQARRDGKNHDVTVPLENGTGLTIHCNNNPHDQAFKHLVSHCEIRKYVHKADRWFGVCMSPASEDVSFAVGRVGPWKFSPELEQEAAALKVRSVPHWVGPAGERTKLGRNDPCPCGSGKKYKKCCLRS
jgi:hypothetical protein